MSPRDTLAAALFAAAAATAHAGPAHGAELRISIENTDGAEGDVYVAVYRGAEGYLDANRAVAKAIVPAAAPTAAFAALPPGEYAVSVFHDRNRNGKMDKNLLGMPTERYGFSNDASGGMGPPAFEAARFAVKDDARIVIRLR